MDNICEITFEVLDAGVKFVFAKFLVPRGDQGGVDDVVELVREGGDACAKWNFEGEVKERRLGSLYATIIGSRLGDNRPVSNCSPSHYT